ncbi:MAG: metallophosphoesterase [bacterium]|nr:metallophosphoesterase [bacterium]
MNLFFDSIILVYLIALATLAVGFFRNRARPQTWESRHPRLTITVLVFLCSSVLVTLWGSFIEPRIITVNHASVDLPNFEPTKPVRVALISDIHVGTYKKDEWLTRIVRRIIKEQPDLVFLAGDFIVNKKEHSKYLSAFDALASAIPTYAVLGDHDYLVDKSALTIDEDAATAVRYALKTNGVKVLSNQTEVIEKNNATFILVGLDDWLAGKTDTEELKNISTEEPIVVPIVVLVHNPDFILDPESKKADLILAGNTHGGQIRLPFIGPVPRLPSQLPRSFDEGLFSVEDHTKLFITSGISESGPRARLFNPPEIVILSLF